MLMIMIHAKWVYLTICTQSRYTYVPCRAYMHVPPHIRHGTCIYPDVYEGVHTCTPSYMLGYMYVPPRIRQGIPPPLGQWGLINNPLAFVIVYTYQYYLRPLID